jgi:hypothetical protein
MKGLLRPSVCEWYFLRLYLLLMTYVAWKMRDDKSGWDSQAYLDAINRAHWFQGGEITQYLYGYHPPLLFLIDRAVTDLHISPLHSVKLVDWLLLLGVFFSVRATFTHLGLLRRWRGVAMLYVSLSIPLNIFLLHAVHMEAPVLLSWSLMLLGIVKLARSRIERDHLIGFALIVFAGVFGLLCKYSALLNLAVPILGACFLSTRKDYLRLWGNLMAAGLVIFAIVLPYFYFRNYLYCGSFMPSNTNIYWFATVFEVYQRDLAIHHPWHFFSELFSLKDFGLGHNLRANHISYIWFDFWRCDVILSHFRHRIAFVGDLYQFAFLGLDLLGLVWFARNPCMFSTTGRFAFLLTTFSALQLASAIYYVWLNPSSGALPVKGMYVTPVCFTVGTLAVLGFNVMMRPLLYRKFYSFYAVTLMFCTALFMCVNYLLIIY